jgi:hypothetical protein
MFGRLSYVERNRKQQLTGPSASVEVEYVEETGPVASDIVPDV